MIEIAIPNSFERRLFNFLAKNIFCRVNLFNPNKNMQRLSSYGSNNINQPNIRVCAEKKITRKIIIILFVATAEVADVRQKG